MASSPSPFAAPQRPRTTKLHVTYSRMSEEAILGRPVASRLPCRRRTLMVGGAAGASLGVVLVVVLVSALRKDQAGGSGALATIRVMTLNTCVEGPARHIMAPWEDMIRRAAADVVVLEEIFDDYLTNTTSIGVTLARALGWHVSAADTVSHTCVISRFALTGGAGRPVEVALPGGAALHVLPVHFTDEPYGPAQLTNMSYPGSPALDDPAEAERQAAEARGPDVRAALATLGPIQGAVQLIAGDFNEPGAVDWSAEEAKRGFCPVAVRWPTSLALEDAAFRDALLEALPNSRAADRVSWPSPGWPDTGGLRGDRIDHLFVRGSWARISAGGLVNPGPVQGGDSPVTDHRGVWVAIEIGQRKGAQAASLRAAHSVRRRRFRAAAP